MSAPRSTAALPRGEADNAGNAGKTSRDNGSAPAALTAFLPLFLLAAGFLVFESHQIIRCIRERTELQQRIAEQEKAVQQGKEIRERLGHLASGVLEAAKTNGNARQIATKYKITPNPPAQPAEAQ